MVRLILLLLVASLAWTAPTVKTVCASGCDYSNLQTALNDAQRGWILELKAGENFDTTTSFSLPSKSGTGWIIVRSSNLHLLPKGRVSPSDAANMPKLRTSGGSYEPVVKVSGAPSAYWRLEGLEMTYVSTGQSNYGAMVVLGDTPNETSPEKVSHHLVIDRCYIHGLDLDEGPKNGIEYNADHVEITNSYLSEIKTTEDSNAEGHVFAAWASHGPAIIRNNFAGGGTIGHLTGGAAPAYPGEYPMFLRYYGNHFKKPGRHQVITYGAEPEGTSFPSTPVEWQPFWRTDESKFYVFDGGSNWIPIESVASNQVCLEDSFWRNSGSGSPYWVCVNGNWQTTGSDRTATGITPPFVGFGQKNLFEHKGVIGSWIEGNLVEGSFYPTWGNQKNAGVLLNWLPQQGKPPSTIREVYFRNNRWHHTGQGVSTGIITVYQTVNSVTQGNPTILGCSDTMMPHSGQYSIVISGATGEWAGINGRWVATFGVSGNETFSIPFDSTGFGALTGTVKMQDETLSFAHRHPTEIVFENNIFSIGEAPEFAEFGTNGILAWDGTYSYGYSAVRGMTAQISFDGFKFRHNTVIKDHQGRSYAGAKGIDGYDRHNAFGGGPLYGIEWVDNLEDAGYTLVNAADSGSAGCDVIVSENRWSNPFMRNSVVTQTGQYSYVSAYTGYFDAVCPTYAWPWKHSGTGVKSNITAAEVTADATHCSGAGGNRLTITLDGGHGLFPNTKFKVSGASPSDINGTYTVPFERYSTGLLPSQTNTTLEVCTSAPVQSYTGVVVEASAGMTDPANGNYRLASSSVYKGWATDGGDPGANQDMVEWATATAESGELNPYLDMGVKRIDPSTVGGSFYFVAYSTNSCSWTISSTRAFSDSLGSVSQSRTGREGTATVTGLSSGTHYWYKLTCDGKYVDGEFITK